MPCPIDAAAASARNPSQTIDEDGTPIFSLAALARNTAGVQLPQQPMLEMTASTPISLKRSGNEASTSCSSEPCVLPNSRQ